MVRKRKKKRTISPEHLAKMQEGRKRAQFHKKRMTRLAERGFSDDLNSVRRK